MLLSLCHNHSKPRRPAARAAAARPKTHSFVRVGAMVFLCHDVNDIFLEGAKMARYACVCACVCVPCVYVCVYVCV